MSYICMLLDGAYPQDIRVRKEAEALVNSGKKVVVVCPAKANDSKKESVNGVEIFRIGSNYSHAKKGIYDVIESIFNINPFFYLGLKKVLKRYAVDFLHVHDLPLAGTGYALRKHIREGLILDLHENYPEALKTWFSWKKSRLIRWKNAIFMDPGKWSKKEKNFCQKYDKVICVVDEMKEKLIKNFALDTSKLIVVSNQEKKTFVENFQESIVQDVIDVDSFSITYVGGFGPHRGLDTAIEAMPLVLKRVPNAKLYLVGKGSSDVEEKLKDIALSKNVTNVVEFIGYRPFKEVPAIMKLSRLNIIPHKANEHTNNTIPHKLFQIMMSKSLLLVSSCKPLKRIVGKYNAGLVFNADDTSDFSNKVIKANEDYDKLMEKRQNAYDAVMQNENWETESQKLIALYDKFNS